MENYKLTGESVTLDWPMIWLIPVVLSLILMIPFAIFFKDESATGAVSDASAEVD